MAMLLVVASTEATDPTRVSDPFRTTVNVSETSTKRLRDETRWVAEEVGAGRIVHDVAQQIPARQTMEPRVRDL
jgi:hypothetical protein